jgi:hypothetical protein
MSHRAQPSTIALLLSFLVFTLSLEAPTTATAQKPTNALFTDYPPWLCVGGSFVAMVGLSKDRPLLVIRIDGKGIEAPQTIPLSGNEVRGLQCSGSRIEVLVWKGGSDIPSILPFTVGYYEIYNEPHEELDWLNSGRARMPSAIQNKVEAFDWIGSRAGVWMRGDWYVEVPRVDDRPNNSYELHFVSNNTGGVARRFVTSSRRTLKAKRSRNLYPLSILKWRM